jgi:hypothetical protein
MRLDNLGVGWEKDNKDEMMAFLVQAQVYNTCYILCDHEITKFVFNKRKMKERRALIKEFDGWRRGRLVALFSKKAVHHTSGDSQSEKDILSETKSDAMAQIEVERSGNKVLKVTPWYDNHHSKAMASSIMMGPKPLAKYDKQCLEQPQLLQH